MFDFQISVNPQSHISPFAFSEKTRPDNHKPKHSIDNTPAPKIVHIGTTPWPCSRQPLPSSQITNSFKIHYFRPVLPSSLCISLRPSRRAVLSRRTQCPKTDFSLNTFAKILKHVAPVIPHTHNNDLAGSTQNPTMFLPIVLPLNPFLSFVLHGTVGGGTTCPNDPDCYPCRSMFGALKPTINARPATYHIQTPISPHLRRCSVAQHPKTRPWNEPWYSTSLRTLRPEQQVVDWPKLPRFLFLLFAMAFVEGRPCFLCLLIARTHPLEGYA